MKIYIIFNPTLAKDRNCEQCNSGLFMIDLLINKIIIYDDKIEIQSPADENHRDLCLYKQRISIKQKNTNLGQSDFVLLFTDNGFETEILLD